jgi:hypothetical protein
MDHPVGAASDRGDRVSFDRRVRLEFRGAQISSDGGLLLMRELDAALGLSDLAATALLDTRRGKNTIHRLDGVFRQSVFGRLAGYEDVTTLTGWPSIRSCARSSVEGLSMHKRPLGLADGMVRDRDTGPGREPDDSGRYERPMDRPLS